MRRDQLEALVQNQLVSSTKIRQPLGVICERSAGLVHCWDSRPKIAVGKAQLL